MSFLKDKKDQVGSLAAIAGITISVVALAITAYSLRDTPKIPSLFFQFSESARYGLIAVTYNGGDAPCAEFNIEYPAKTGKLQHIVQYQQSVLPNAKINDIGIVYLPRSRLSPVGKCGEEKCVIEGGFLGPNQVFALKLPKGTTNIKMTVSCINDSSLVSAKYEA